MDYYKKMAIVLVPYLSLNMLTSLGKASSIEDDTGKHLEPRQMVQPCISMGQAYGYDAPVKIVQHHHQPWHANLMDELYQKRYEVFFEKLKWNIPVKDKRDIDQYDVPQAIYLVYHDQKYGVCGGARLLPTTGTYMLKDIFSHLMDDPDRLPSRPDTWEITRFFFSKPKHMDDSLGFTRRGTAELLIGLHEFALSWNIKKVVSVTHPRLETLVNNIGWPARRLSQAKIVQGEPVVVLEMDVAENILVQMREKAKIKTPVSVVKLPFTTLKAEGFQMLAHYNHLKSKL